MILDISGVKNGQNVPSSPRTFHPHASFDLAQYHSIVYKGFPCLWAGIVMPRKLAENILMNFTVTTYDIIFSPTLGLCARRSNKCLAPIESGVACSDTSSRHASTKAFAHKSHFSSKLYGEDSLCFCLPRPNKARLRTRKAKYSVLRVNSKRHKLP